MFDIKSLQKRKILIYFPSIQKKKKKKTEIRFVTVSISLMINETHTYNIDEILFLIITFQHIIFFYLFRVNNTNYVFFFFEIYVESTRIKIFELKNKFLFEIS